MEYEAQCVICGDRFLAGKPNATTCCSAHRQLLHRRRVKAAKDEQELARRRAMAGNMRFSVVIVPDLQ